MMRSLLILLCVATPAFAQDWFMRDGDVLFTETELNILLSGNAITFYDDGVAQFFADETYIYTYANDGGSADGQYKVNSDSTVCIDFNNGFSRCDLYVFNNDRLVMVTQDGTRFPVRPGASVTIEQ